MSDLDLKWVPRPAKAVNAADRLIAMKKTHNVWEVIDEVFKVWSSHHPEKWKSFVWNVRDVKETRIDKKFGTSKTKGSNLRYYIDIPQDVIYMLRTLYTPDELPMNSKFFREFAKRFPKFKVVDKV